MESYKFNKLNCKSIREATKRIQNETGMSFDPREFIDKYLFATIAGVEVIHHNDLLHSMGATLAGASFFAMMDGTKSKSFIVVDDDFINAPANVRKWIAYHEMGHICGGHLNRDCKTLQMDNVKRLVLSCIGVATALELEADSFAIKKTSIVESVRVLNWMKRRMTNINGQMELSSRIRHAMEFV